MVSRWWRHGDLMNDQLTIGRFLRRLWPETGHYCIAHKFPLPDGGTGWWNVVFPTISEAVTHCNTMIDARDTYFSMFTLAQASVWDPHKLDPKTGNLGKSRTRFRENMLVSRCLFWDLDVGSESHKYATQRDAIVALTQFLQTTGLPTPLMVDSGYGAHIYWRLSEDVPVAEWRQVAWHLFQLGKALGMKPDASKAYDPTSVLRVVGTKNWKNKPDLREVRLVEEGAPPVPFAALRQAIHDAMIAHGVAISDPPEPRAPRAAAPIDPDLPEQKFADPAAPTLDELGDICAQVKQIVLSHLDPSNPHYGEMDNNAWYKGAMATIKRVEDGDNWCRKLTSIFPRTSSNIEAKLRQLDENRAGPANCSTLQEVLPWGDAPCQGCPHFKSETVRNPFTAARRKVSAPPPVVETTPPAPPAPPVAPAINLTPITGAQVMVLPDPPPPYVRMKGGGISIVRTNKDGEEVSSVIYAYDLFPLRRLVNAANSTEQQVWRAILPRSGARDFVIDADTLYDSRKFCAAMAHNGVYPHKADISALQDYMVAYISQLQKSLDGEAQHAHLGWHDEHQEFILPDKLLRADGAVRSVSLTTGAANASQFIRKKGTLANQVALLHFFNRPEYLPNQVAILASLGSILFDMTGHHGVIINMSGQSGASKSTTLLTGASLWGDPVLLPLNGTQSGATTKARLQRLATNGSLPTFVDEITGIPYKEVQDLAMSVTQPGHRVRLMVDGTERKQTDTHKSAIMITTANTSLHSLLSQDNVAGTAGSMRVFEMRFTAQKVHSKADADEFLIYLRDNYGHVGEIVAGHVVRNYAAVQTRLQQVMREIDREASIQSHERYWSGVCAVVVVVAEIALQLGLAPYTPDAIRRFLVDVEIPYMRGTVKEEYRDPLAVLTDYIAERQGNILVVDRSTALGANTSSTQVGAETAFALNKPSGALLGHYDKKAAVLYLNKQAFKEHCQRCGAISAFIINDLAQPRQDGAIVVQKAVRRTLGAGTEYAKGQSWCIAINMAHPEISGVTSLTSVTGGTQQSAPTGNLKAVQ